MPNLVESRVGPLGDKAPSALPSEQSGLYLRASDGREFLLTRRQVRQQFLTADGTVTERRQTVRQWIRGQLVATLGAEQADPAGISADFDENDGTPTQLEVS